MKAILSLILSLVVIILLALMTSQHASISARQITASEIEAEFLYADLVVEGIVMKITKDMVPHEDFLPGIPGPKLPFAKITFKVVQTLIGKWDSDYLPLVGLLMEKDGYLLDLDEGDRYILSLRYYEGSGYFEGGTYLVRPDDRYRLLVEDNKWIRGRKSAPIGSGALESLYNAIYEIGNRRSIEYLTAEADLIVRGIVVDAVESNTEKENGTYTQVIDITMKIEGTIKGDPANEHVTFKTISAGDYSPYWRTRVPDIQPGEKWFVFLKLGNDTWYYPFAGVNGLFKIEHEKLIRDNNNRMETEYSPDGLERLIRNVLERVRR